MSAIGSPSVSAGVPFWDVNQALAGMPGFTLPPTEWDVVRYGPSQIPLPGLVKVKRCSRHIRMHKKDMPANDGATQTFLGMGLVVFDFDLILWTADQLAAWTAVLPQLQPSKGTPVTYQQAVQTQVPTQAQVPITKGSFVQNPAQSAADIVDNSTVGIPGFDQTTMVTQVGQKTVQQVQTKTLGTFPLPVLLSHPDLLLFGVRSMILLEVEALRPWEGHPDIFYTTLKWEQFSPPKPIQPKTQTGPNTSRQGRSGLPLPANAAQAPSLNGGANP